MSEPATAAPRSIADRPALLALLALYPSLRVLTRPGFATAIVCPVSPEGRVGETLARLPRQIVTDALAAGDLAPSTRGGMVYGLPRPAASARARLWAVHAMAEGAARPGVPPLTAAEVRAAERLAEDFAAAAGSPLAALLSAERLADPRPPVLPAGLAGGEAANAALRAIAALRALVAPDLIGVALAVICWREGLEAAERQLGLPARSGKVLLRAACGLLARHDAEAGR